MSKKTSKKPIAKTLAPLPLGFQIMGRIVLPHDAIIEAYDEKMRGAGWPGGVPDGASSGRSVHRSIGCRCSRSTGIAPQMLSRSDVLGSARASSDNAGSGFRQWTAGEEVQS